MEKPKYQKIEKRMKRLLSEQERAAIRVMYHLGISGTKIAEMFQVNSATVYYHVNYLNKEKKLKLNREIFQRKSVEERRASMRKRMRIFRERHPERLKYDVESKKYYIYRKKNNIDLS